MIQRISKIVYYQKFREQEDMIIKISVLFFFSPIKQIIRFKHFDQQKKRAKSIPESFFQIKIPFKTYQRE